MSIYVISNDLNIENNLFKIGRTKDTNSEIVTKYQRYLSGARLLLWYPSTLTHYVEDEKELLRLFDANRNRTPNGFKNEWLSISFEQLKTRLDEYFGQDGENFEEERKREQERKEKEREERVTERTTRVIICEYCDVSFTTNQSLKRHYGRCKEKEKRNLIVYYDSQIETYERQLQEQRDQYERQLQEQRDQYERQLQEQRDQYEKETQLLKEQLTEFKNQIFEIAK